MNFIDTKKISGAFRNTNWHFIQIDASYLYESKSRSRAGVSFYIKYATEDISWSNGAIMVISTIISNVMLSAAKAECGSLFYNVKELEALITTLKDMGHP